MVANSSETDLDSGSVLEVLDGVLRYLDESAKEELRRSKIGEGTEFGLGHDAGDRGSTLAFAGGLYEASDGEGIFHPKSVPVEPVDVLQHNCLDVEVNVASRQELFRSENCSSEVRVSHRENGIASWQFGSRHCFPIAPDWAISEERAAQAMQGERAAVHSPHPRPSPMCIGSSLSVFCWKANRIENECWI